MDGPRLLRALPLALVALLALSLAKIGFDGWSWLPALGLVLVGLAAAFLPALPERKPRTRTRTRTRRRRTKPRARTRRRSRSS
ncbi:hypothetical protein [Sanguibacter antarcticus]|uniref:Uncharacterized protein n=1 Tax=Sanguibacter antarcticus TaxID=372484 RepID=A0A2A9E7F4_9MICO|nr:hypothetical protein [Sanguibacter antarcticus]PFG34245.1 hypothetical protein ATL42_2151 [Sanguibacter antarcticus]